MRAVVVLCLTVAMASLTCSRAAAQEPPPRIGPFVVDVRGTVPKFPGDPALAASRGLLEGELPGAGLGIDAGAHVYLFTWKAVTVGVGVQVTLARSHASPPVVPNEPTGREVTERLTSMSPQLSLNFGNGSGWSYISGGLGPSIWSIVPVGDPPRAADEERLRTFNYGGGARWFAKPHVAFTLDVRFYAINPGTPSDGYPGSPRTTMLIIGAGVSVK